MKDIKSSESEWLNLSKEWYVSYTNKTSISDKVEYIYETLDKAKQARSYVAGKGIGSVSVPVDFSEIEEHNEKRRKIVYFCNGVHYEMSKLVDNPFCLNVSETATNAIDLDPSNLGNVSKDSTLYGAGSISSLYLLAMLSKEDEALRKDFLEKYRQLNNDEPSSTLKDAIDVAEFWRSEYEKSEQIKQIASDVFNAQVRKDWATMTEDERMAIVTDYAHQVGGVYYQKTWWDKLWNKKPSIVGDIGLVSGYNGQAWPTGGKVDINELFVKEGTKNYSVDKVIDTLTHETRHTYQFAVKADPEKYNVPQSIVDAWKAGAPDPSKDYDGYYHSDIETDAKAFAALSRPEDENDEDEK